MASKVSKVPWPRYLKRKNRPRGDFPFGRLETQFDQPTHVCLSLREVVSFHLAFQKNAGDPSWPDAFFPRA